MSSTIEDTASWLAKWSMRGPRYTSYPPATEFAPIAADSVAGELQRLSAAADSVSLYVHIPFCRSLCAYCGCNVIPTRDSDRGLGYVDQLATEIALVSGQLVGAPVTEIALGGGSPNFLEPRSLRALVGFIERCFAVAPTSRRSIELDPRTTTPAQIETLADVGFRSLSMGVQDFAEPVQEAIRRHQSVDQTKWLVDQARAAKFDDINIDIVYGLPRQTEASFTQTLKTVLSLSPDRVALFGYAHLPSKLPHQRLVERAGRVLDQYERATLMVMAIEYFASAGYIHLGLDHFARPDSRLARAASEGRMVRTFQGYVEECASAIIGLGASAISSTPYLHWQNHSELAAWQAAIAARQLPIERGFSLDDDDRVRATVINRLMCDGSVDLAQIGRQFDLDPDVYFAHELEALAKLDELVTCDRTTQVVRTTARGRLLVRNVCMVFDRYNRDEKPQQFSSTI